MKTKDLKINFRYLVGNIACLSVDSIAGKSIHNDINNEEAIIIFNSLVGEKENCQTVKKLLQENQELKEKLDKYENPEDMTLMMMWCTEKVKDENEKLKEEITNLSKDVDMWNAKYNDMFDENKRLKEALEAKSYCKYANKCDELNDCSREEYEDMSNANVRLNVENYDLKEENRELKKQLEERPKEYVFIGNAQNKTRDFINQITKDNKEFKNQQKEFINYLEDEINKWNYNYDSYNYEYEVEEPTAEELANKILQKYKEIIGVSDENTIK